MTPILELKEVADIQMGSAPPGSSYNNSDEGLPMIAGAGDYGETHPAPKKWTNAPIAIANVGDLIICVRATIGDLNWADRKYCLGRGVAGIRAKDGTADINYLSHYINYKKQELAKLGTGSTFLAIRRGDLETFPVLLPSLKKQNHVASILDKAAEICRKCDQAIQMDRDFLHSLFLDMFGDQEINPKGFPKGTLRDLTAAANYGSSAKADSDVREFPVLRMGNITATGYWDFKDLKYINLAEKDKPKYLAHQGDLLFNRTNSKELVGKTAVFDQVRPMAYAGYLIRVRTNGNGNPYYLWGYLNSAHGKQKLKSMCKSIVGMANINAQELQDMQILIPPKKLQDEFQKRVAVVDELRKKMLAYKEKCFNLASSLSHEFFNG